MAVVVDVLPQWREAFLRGDTARIKDLRTSGNVKAALWPRDSRPNYGAFAYPALRSSIGSPTYTDVAECSVAGNIVFLDQNLSFTPANDGTSYDVFFYVDEGAGDGVVIAYHKYDLGDLVGSGVTMVLKGHPNGLVIM